MATERIWLVRQLPTDTPDRVSLFEQFYVSLEPEVYLWKSNHSYLIVVAGAAQELVSDKFYDKTLKAIEKEPIVIRRYTYVVGQHEISVSDMDKGAVMYAKVVFDCEEDADNYVFPWPELIIREVTNEQDNEIANYWYKTRCAELAGCTEE